MACKVCRIGDTDFWAASLDLSSGQNEPGCEKDNSPVALHFVIDNSGSMGSMTTDVKNLFAELVDSAASAPCSLTLFSETACLLSDRLRSSKQMRDLPKVKQGLTNIPAGVKQAMAVISAAEQSEVSQGVTKKTHHVLILLTDGLHNRGPEPHKEFPLIGEEARRIIPNVQLSVVVVGITRESSTSMGMLLKTNLETVPLGAAAVDNIYFAATRSSMRSVVGKLVEGLNALSAGSLCSISCPSGYIVAEVGNKESQTINVRTTADKSSVAFLLGGQDPPSQLTVDGSEVQVIEGEEIDHDLIADILAGQIDRVRVQRVASAGSTSVRPAIQQLMALVDALEKNLKLRGGTKLALARASAADRLAQHRNVVKSVHMARELRNQLAEVANFKASCSEEQAAFLTGSRSKYASKAMRRAAARSGDGGLLDPQKELSRVQREVGDASFAGQLRELLRIDTINHLKRLSKKQREALEEHVEARSGSDFSKLLEILTLQDFGSFSTMVNATQEEAPENGKVHTSALCWIPPTGGVFEDIQAIRKEHDRQIKRWPPHINLLYPFVPSEDFEDAATKLARALCPIHSFCVNLSGICSFAHSSRSHTAWLHPEETNEFESLQAACKAVFPQCDDLDKRGAFVPHLTVGQCTSKSAVEALEASAAWEPSLTKCGEVCLISRKGQDEPFEVHWRVELGTGKLTAMPAATAVQGLGMKNTSTANENTPFTSMTPALLELIDSGALAGYLNDVFFGERRSYLSLMSPWEHIAEWRDVSKNDQEFKSQWEMLLYAGSAAYPIVVERSAGTQLNPFQLAVKKIHTTMVDTASLCCANHSEIDTFGPEAGEPIKDALVLVDPSSPRASAKIASTALLGETFTSVVLSRDLHMYTGAQMKAALHAHSLFRCLQPESDEKSRSDAAAEIRREFLGRAYQCGSCGFGPVDHGGCRDLFAHHGEDDGTGGVASNACPSCGWFSGRLGDWDAWDGTIPHSMLCERTGAGRGGREKDVKDAPKLLEAKADMVLRILYSFRKTFGGRANPMRAWYNELAKRLVDWDLRLTTQDEVDGLVQILVAAAACDDDVLGDAGAVEAAFAPPVLLSIVNEACARAARKKFRMAAGGDDGKAKELAADRVTEMLGITRESAPETTGSLLESEPNREVIEERCRRDYRANFDAGRSEMQWAEKLATRWCTALDFVWALRCAIVRRGGGWDRLERDMETSLGDYADVVRDLTAAPLRPYLEACNIDDANADRTLMTMAAQAFLNGKGADRADLADVRDGETLRDIARDMRMRIYTERVREKMAQWKCEGQRMVFLRARAVDIGQYEHMVNAKGHVHGLSKEDFWGLWEAATCDGYGGEKVMAFLDTANEEFCQKYASGAKKKRRSGR